MAVSDPSPPAPLPACGERGARAVSSPLPEAGRGARGEGFAFPFSIIIPSYQRADLLTLCLASVQRHAPAATQIIVVDDASPDGRISAAARAFPGVQVVRLRLRSGFCGAVNAGLAAATGEVVELLNDDAEVTAGWAAPALRWFRDPTVGAVAPLVLWGPAGDKIDSAGDRYFLGGVAAKRGHGQPLAAAPVSAGPVFGASGSSAFYRRDALLRVGAFPEYFRAYFEDVDVALRLRRAGYTAMYEPASRVLHRVSASYGRPRRRLLEQQSCNEERVFWRNLPLRAWPWHAVVLAAKAWRRWNEGTLAPFICGRARILTEIGEVWHHRQHLRALGATAPERWGVEARYWGA